MSDDIRIARFTSSVLVNNTSGSVTIPISSSPALVTLATLNLRSDRNHETPILLTATVGWLATTNGTGLSRVDVLFKIWRGNPAFGQLIFSSDDSGGSGSNSRITTSFTHVDNTFDCRSQLSPSYFLTAELPDADSSATVVGPITLVGIEFGGC